MGVSVAGGGELPETGVVVGTLVGIIVEPGAIDEARKRKPSIPEVGNYGIPLKDALKLEFKID